jgi:hypothetical protein
MGILSIALAFLKNYLWEILGVLAIGLVVFFVYNGLSKWCNKACEKVTVRAVDAESKVLALESSIQAARDRATALALLWSKEVTSSEKKYAQELQATLDLFHQLDARSKGVSRTPVLPVAPSTNRLLSDATAAANATNPPTATDSIDPSAAVPAAPQRSEVAEGSILSEEDITSSWISAAKAYASCKLAWASCVSTYNAIREGGSVVLPDVQTK